MSRIYTFVLLYTICLLFPLLLTGQSATNSWIIENQDYFKLEVTENGIYKVLGSDLIAAGIPSNLGGNFHVYHNGKKIFTKQVGLNDGTINPTDFVSFYGQNNDGALDSTLYEPGDQAHLDYSLFSDTSYYYITVDNSPLKTTTNLSLPITGIAEETFNHSQTFIFPEAYYLGIDLTQGATFSEYVNGEGWFSNRINRGGSRTFSLNTFGYVNNGSQIDFKTKIYGRSNAFEANPNHHTRLEVGPNGTDLQSVADTLFTGYSEAIVSKQITADRLGASTSVRISSINDLGVAADNIAISHFTFTYPRNFQVQGNELNFNLPFSSGAKHVAFSNLSDPTNISVWNNSTGTIVNGNTYADTLEIMLPVEASENEFYLFDTTTITNLIPSKVEEQKITVNPEWDFIIITHKSLRQSALEYENYRKSTGRNVNTVTTDELYFNYYFGQHHPMAIRNYAKELLATANQKPLILLLGKGQEASRIRQNTSNFQLDLVPTFGVPGSDVMFTSGIVDSLYKPDLPISRIPAQTNDDVRNYLQRLQEYEALPDSQWRKRVVHLSGGTNLFENNSFKSYTSNYRNIIEGALYGAKDFSYHKNVNDPISGNFKGRIVGKIDEGIGFLSFFGHGSSQGLELDFGKSEDLAITGRHTIMMYNGCSAGNTFNKNSVAENYILAKEKGAIGWIATSDLGFPSYLNGFTSIFYKVAFTDSFGLPISKLLAETVGQFQKADDKFNRLHARQYNFHGDPALTFYAPKDPDWAISRSSLYIHPQNVTAVSDSFAVAIVVNNNGKATEDSLSVVVSRKLPDGKDITYLAQEFPPIFYRDTLFYYIKSKDLSTRGLNSFTVSINQGTGINELSLANNTASFDFIMPANGVNIVSPDVHGIVGKSPIKLTAQSNNLKIGNANYIFEIDTVSDFSSSFKQNSGVLAGKTLISWTPTFTPTENQVYFWRMKLDLPINEGGLWQNSDFTYRKDANSGISLSKFAQFNPQYNNMVGDTTYKTFEFTEDAIRISIFTRGDVASSSTGQRILRINSNKAVQAFQEKQGVYMLALNPSSFDRFGYESQYNIVHIDGIKSSLFNFNTNVSAQVDSMNDYLNRIPDGHYVYVYNGKNFDPQTFSEATLTAFEDAGASQIRTVQNGWPYMLMGRKNDNSFTSVEFTADTLNNPTPPKEQTLFQDVEFVGKYNQGSLTSQNFGPSRGWETASFNLLKGTESDSFKVSIIGVKPNGEEEVLYADPSETTDLSSVSTDSFKNLRYSIYFRDDSLRTPSTVKDLTMYFVGTPEVSVFPDSGLVSPTKVIQEGDSISFSVMIKNLLELQSDSLEVNLTVLTASRNEIEIDVKSIGQLEGLNTAAISTKFSSLGLVGENQLIVSVLPLNGLDKDLSNNFYSVPFTVVGDNTNPLLDVRVDGRKILDGELIQPQPEITITLSDDNEFRALNDTSNMMVWIKNPNDADFTILPIGTAGMNFSPGTSEKNAATLVYNPQSPFDNGVHTMRVQGSDASGNSAGKQAYEISFEVDDRETITQIYPYPNPFSTSMQFVFTLTGSQVPEEITIQIFTVSGKLVREVTKNELGPLKIGNNISDFRWNGTDEFGDQLANGVYFYNVKVSQEGRQYEKRGSAGDKFFKKNIGKIYLMR